MKKFYIFMIVLFSTATVFAAKVESIQFTAVSEVENTVFQNLDFQIKKKIKTSYSDGKLNVTGIYTISTIAIYNLLGRKVVDLKNIAINGSFSKYLDLPKNNIYIVKISSAVFTKTFKIVAK